jgi:hypothetical protein
LASSFIQHFSHSVLLFYRLCARNQPIAQHAAAHSSQGLNLIATSLVIKLYLWFAFLHFCGIPQLKINYAIDFEELF